MLSIQPLKSARGAVDYYLRAFNYYQGDAMATAWIGSAKKYIPSLGDNVDEQSMLPLLEGYLPDGSKLQNNRGEHRPGFDMTFSAPKSVSILAGLDADPELVHFHDEAVKFALSKIESEFAEVRYVKNSDIHFEKTGNLLSATFRQPSSRANDPALHTHCVTFNLTFYQGKAKSLATDAKRTHGVVEQIQNNAHYCGLLYRHHLANQLKNAGYSLRLTGDGLFEIDGISDEVLRHFSQRRESIEQLMEDKGWTGAKSASNAALLTRDAKEEYDINTLKQDWQERSNSLGFDANAFVKNRTQTEPNTLYSSIKEKIKQMLSCNQKELTEEEIAAACVFVAIETLSQRTSVFTHRALKAEALKHSLTVETAVSELVIVNAISSQIKQQNLYVAHCARENQTFLTTPWLLTLEAESLARIEYNKDSVTAIANKGEIKALQDKIDQQNEHPLTASQKAAMLAILTTKDRYLAVQGYAGVAKTTMLKEAKVLIEEKGYVLRGITIASSAAEELQTKAGIRADVFSVVHQELKQARKGALSKTIFIVDEASMLSSPQGHELIKRVEQINAKLILVGDKAQLPTVNNGRLFGLTQDYGIETVVMDEIVRQKNPEAKKSVIHATKGEVREAIDYLHHVEELESYDSRVQWIANTWLAKHAEDRRNTLLFAPTHVNRHDITQLIRHGLETEGSLTGAPFTQTTLKAKGIEAVQQRFVAYYQKGDVIRFNQDFRQNRVIRGYYTVGNITKNNHKDNVLPLLDASGKKHLFALKHLPQYKATTSAFERVIEVYQAKRLDLKVGDQLMWTRNFKAENIRNGQRAKLSANHNDELVFTLEDGAKVSLAKNNPALKHLDYGYVLTNYKVQGKDAAHAIGLMDSHHRFSATLKNFYVQISRAVKSMTLVTDDKEQLIHAIGRNNDEKLAVLDKFSSQQLKVHDERFTHQIKLSLQPVIDKKLEFESRTITTQVRELNFTQLRPQPQLVKELER